MSTLTARRDLALFGGVHLPCRIAFSTCNRCPRRALHLCWRWEGNGLILLQELLLPAGGTSLCRALRGRRWWQGGTMCSSYPGWGCSYPRLTHPLIFLYFKIMTTNGCLEIIISYLVMMKLFFFYVSHGRGECHF